MKERTRRFLIVASAIMLVGSIGGLVGLKLGRPLFYTDGDREVLGAELANAPMLVWERPEPDVEIPGPVRGRVQTLPDGRLLYGRLSPAGSTDLVVFDPARSTLPPERVVALNSRGHDLAPALAADGTLYFSSDRRGGLGGFDLYRASYRGGAFGDVERLPAWVNSAFDETDPAPDPRGGRVVFVRRDPDVRSGQNGVIMLGSLESDEAAVPLYATTVQPAPVDRDPAFAPDGVSLWFVRQTAGEPPVIMRAWRLAEEFAPPVAQDGLRAGGPFRAPEPAAEGLSVRLLQPGTSAEPGTRALVYRSRAREIFPWWAGQAGLELLLFALATIFATLLLLLLLGRIWRQLDVITWCLLLSLFVHLLVLMWLTDVEIVRRFMPSAPPEGRLSVELVSGTRAEQGSGLEVAQAMRDAHVEVQFASQARDLSAGAPGAEVSEPERRDTERGEWKPQSLPEATSTPVEAGVADEVPELTVREGQDAQAELSEVAVSTQQAEAARLRAERQELPSSMVRVEVPAAAPAPAQRSAPTRTTPAQPVPKAAVAATSVTAVAPISVDDSPPMQVIRPDTGPAEQPMPSLRAVATAARPEAAARPGRAAGAPPQLPAGEPAGGSLLAPATPVAPPSGSPSQSMPNARELAVAAEMRDALPAARPAAARNDPGTPLAAAPSVALTRQTAALDVQRTTAKPAPSAGVQAPSVDIQRSARRVAPPAIATPSPVEPATVAPATVAVAASEVRDAVELPSTTGPARAGADEARPSLMAATTVPLSTPRRQAPAFSGPELSSPRPSATVAPPSSNLARAARRQPRSQARTRTQTNTAVPNAAVPLVAVRDQQAEPRALPDVPETGGRRAAAALVPAPVAVTRPTTAALSRPARPRSRGVDPITGSIRIPGSLLTRAPRAEYAPVEPVTTAAVSDLFRNRFGAEKVKALERFGGSEETERAVRMGLAYLASIQNKDGSWGSRRRLDDKYGEVFIGKTALCLLAFLGAGHTPTSNTEYSELTRRTVRRLVREQDLDSGHFGRASSYSHGITTYALAECYGMTRDEKLVEPVEAALEWVLANQSRSRDRRDGGGWGYYSGELAPEDRSSRSSITAWMVMALESAKLAGLEVPQRALDRAKGFLLNAWDRRYGHFRYNHRPEWVNSDWPTLPASTPASVFALMLMGQPKDDVRIRTGLEYTLERKPRRYERPSRADFVLRARGNVYYWYYGSLACFVAGDEVWEDWNEALKSVLPDAQNDDGSFEPLDPYAEIARDHAGDKSYTTAMCVLSLEVYYRYFTPLLEKQ